MRFFDKIPPDQFSVLASLLGVVLSSDLTPGEQNAIGNFFLSLGQSILTLVAQAENQKTLKEQHDQTQYINQQLESLTAQIKLLQAQRRG